MNNNTSTVEELLTKAGEESANSEGLVKDDILLKVEHLSQYFKMGNNYLKAVNDVNFDIKKGEVFGLVGESGCGKTTTGRTIIKLYNATDGNVYFKGERIVAGVMSYKNKIKAARKKALYALIKKNKDEENAADFKQCFDEYLKVRKVEGANIRSAKHDQKKCDKDYAKEVLSELHNKYKPQIDELTVIVNELKQAGKTEELAAKSEELSALKKEYAKERRIARKSRLVNKIQMVFQDPIASLDPRMTVREIISEGLVIHGIRDKKVIEARVSEMLEKVGLVSEHANRYPHEFSGGQRQRIGVARAIIMEPELIIADEPVSALDVSIQAQVINLLNDLRQEMGLTILFIAHDLSVVKYFSDRIGVMYFGNMVELTTSDELFAHPLHPYTRSLLSAIPLPDPIYEKKRKRITYNPLAEHDYSVDKPTFREITKGHWVSCNDKEEQEYRKILGLDN